MSSLEKFLNVELGGKQIQEKGRAQHRYIPISINRKETREVLSVLVELTAFHGIELLCRELMRIYSG